MMGAYPTGAIDNSLTASVITAATASGATWVVCENVLDVEKCNGGVFFNTADASNKNKSVAKRAVTKVHEVAAI